MIWEKHSDPDHPDVAWGLVNLGDLLLLARRPREALPLLERAVHIMNAHDGVQPLEFAAHFALARAIVAVGGETSRALAEARRARDGDREAGEVERWLARHGERR